MKHRCHVFVLLMVANQLLSHGLGTKTPVHRDKIRQPIEHIFQNPSNKKLSVSSYDFDTNMIVKSYIKTAGQSRSNCHFQISFDDNPNNDIFCTPSQEFYDVNAHHWTPALQLRIGDELLSAHGKYAITSITFINKSLKVYALEVESTHNFFVGPYAILTHNMLLPWALSAGLGISFGAGAAAGGTAGGCFGPITLVGGAVIGGIICAGIKMLTSNSKVKYALYFDTNTIEKFAKTNVLYQENENSKILIDSPKNKTTKKSKDRKIYRAKTVNDILQQAKPGRKTMGKTKQFEKVGGFNNAMKDFESLNPKEVKDIPIGKRGVLADGRDVNVRIKSSAGKPTLEIYNKHTKSSIKIRYHK